MKYKCGGCGTIDDHHWKGGEGTCACGHVQKVIVLDRSSGLGDTLEWAFRPAAHVLVKAGVMKEPTCQKCNSRRKKLNRWFPYPEWWIKWLNRVFPRRR